MLKQTAGRDHLHSSPNTWIALWADLGRQISTVSAAHAFGVLRCTIPALAPFPEPMALVSFLARRDVNLDQVDNIYAELVSIVQTGGSTAKLATALIWLGLRPALDRIYRQRQRWSETPNAAASEVAHAFTEVIHRADLGQITKVASTLVRNTKRNLVELYQQAWAQAETPTDQFEALADPRHDTNAPRLFSEAPRASADYELHMLRQRLQPHLGRNTDVVLGAIVLGASHREMAAHLGIPYEGIRKRFQGSLRRLRRHIDGCP